MLIKHRKFKRNILIIGLTGGICSGKTTVAKEFARLGAKIINADEIGHNLISPGRQAWKKIVKSFGRDILQGNNIINRKKLAGIVFQDQSKRKLLEKITHPLIISEIFKSINRAVKSKKYLLVVIDAPLLFESGLYKHMDKNITVWIPKKIQTARLKKRDKLGILEINSRINSQMPASNKKKMADYIINNTLPANTLNLRIKSIIKKII